jgi:hypothetical protein
MKITVHVVSHSIQPDVFVDAAAAELVRSNAAPGTVTLTSHEIEIAGAWSDEDMQSSFEEHQDKLQRRLLDPMAVALGIASGAICSLQEQIGQMRGLFSDSDGAIAQAMEDGDNAYDEIKALLDRYSPGAPLPMVSEPAEDQTAANGAKLCAECGNDFWGECLAQRRADWRDEVVKEKTSLGYWEWAAARMASEICLEDAA